MLLPLNYIRLSSQKQYNYITATVCCWQKCNRLYYNTSPMSLVHHNTHV